MKVNGYCRWLDAAGVIAFPVGPRAKGGLFTCGDTEREPIVGRAVSACVTDERFGR